MIYIFILLISLIIYLFGFNFESNETPIKFRHQLSYYTKLKPIIKNYDYYLNYKPCAINCIGIEMELEFLKAEPDLVKWQNLLNSVAYDSYKWHDLIFLKYDYTVPFGVEINFQPLKFYDYYKINWKPFFNLLIEETGVTHLDTGLHLHLPYTPEKNIYKILELLIMNKEFIVKFMDRDNISFSRFCDPKIFKTDYLKCIGKLYVLNINKSIPTIEVRGFKTTLDVIKFNKYVSFMEYLEELSLSKN